MLNFSLIEMLSCVSVVRSVKAGCVPRPGVVDVWDAVVKVGRVNSRRTQVQLRKDLFCCVLWALGYPSCGKNRSHYNFE
jgi:hypothetical protein